MVAGEADAASGRGGTVALALSFESFANMLTGAVQCLAAALVRVGADDPEDAVAGAEAAADCTVAAAGGCGDAAASGAVAELLERQRRLLCAFAHELERLCCAQAHAYVVAQSVLARLSVEGLPTARAGPLAERALAALSRRLSQELSVAAARAQGPRSAQLDAALHLALLQGPAPPSVSAALSAIQRSCARPDRLLAVAAPALADALVAGRRAGDTEEGEGGAAAASVTAVDIAKLHPAFCAPPTAASAPSPALLRGPAVLEALAAALFHPRSRGGGGGTGAHAGPAAALSAGLRTHALHLLAVAAASPAGGGRTESDVDTEGAASAAAVQATLHALTETHAALSDPQWSSKLPANFEALKVLAPRVCRPEGAWIRAR